MNSYYTVRAGVCCDKDITQPDARPHISEFRHTTAPACIAVRVDLTELAARGMNGFSLSVIW
jgi:hypothetical protein